MLLCGNGVCDVTVADTDNSVGAVGAGKTVFRNLTFSLGGNSAKWMKNGA